MLGEIARGLENLEFACGVPHLLKGGYSEQVSGGIDVYQIRQPLGVVAGITPFNFPAMVPMWMFANAIACGNTFVLKPSEKDPSASLFLAELLAEAGVPDGVFNVVQGDKVAVDRILEHPDVAAVSFVGSTPIAKYIYETGTRNGKRVQALGGAKNHMIVLPDADIDMAADAAVSAAYGSAGERCMAISVVVAVGDVADPLVGRSRAAAEDHGRAGLRPEAEMGPLVTREHRDKVASTSTRPPRRAPRSWPTAASTALAEDGFFLGVSLIDNVKPGHGVVPQRDLRAGARGHARGHLRRGRQLVNDNPYGNGTAIFTRDGGAARQFQFEVQAGMVGINVPIPVPVAYYSFGGWKASLFGDLHMYGPEGVQFYTRGKVVTSRWPDPATSRSTSASRRTVGGGLRAQGPAAHRRGRRRLHPAAGRPADRGLDDQGREGGCREGRARSPTALHLRGGTRVRRRRHRPPARPVPVVRRHGGQPRADIVTRYGDDPAIPRRSPTTSRAAGLRLQRARPGREHPHGLRARRDRRPVLHPRHARAARRSGWRSSEPGRHQFAVYLQHDGKEQTLEAYGETVIPAVAEKVIAKQ
jgi:malonate-semialdehyde dehydrogenase (acetylating) / methylmalonate-semialdehyde dehydrogenase